MRQDTQSERELSIGLDLGDRFSHVCAVRRGGEIELEKRLATKREIFQEFFSGFAAGTRVVCEAGTHSPWVSALIEEIGLEAVVANPNAAGRLLAANGRKNDRLDATTLGILGFDSLRLLRPITHRGREAQSDLAVLKARRCAVRMRKQAINTVRGLVKSSGQRLPNCSTESFHRKVLEFLPEELQPALRPLLEHIAEISALIRHYDKKIEELSKKYPETERLRAIVGVGPLISLAFVLILDDPKRFRRSREVGAFVGLVPKQHESGDKSPELRITKAGNKYLRELLINGAHYILGPFGEDCDLRRFGERIAARGGTNQKKRAVTAVARKLAVVMHRLWLSEESYDPFYRDARRKRLSA